jgi:predicted Fe-Mo cluster-binding NifX family protein
VFLLFSIFFPSLKESRNRDKFNSFIMKIAIPTDDGFTINQQFTTAKGFLVSTIQFGEVVEQEMRWNLNNEIPTSEDESYKTLVDCDKVIVREIEFNQSNFLQLHKIDVIKTEETIVTKVLMQYLQTVMQKESDTCCCP